MQAALKIIQGYESPATNDIFLGPAGVKSVTGSEIIVELRHGDLVQVALAFAFPYEPRVDDTLLVIGKDDGYYAIGVLQGTGKASLSFEGNVDLRANGGKLTLSGDQGVELEGPEFSVHVRHVRMFADKVTEKLGSLYQRIGTLLSVHAKEVHTIVEGTTLTQAKNATITTEEMVTVNGKQIHLG